MPRARKRSPARRRGSSASGFELADPLGRDVVADDPRERMPLAHPARDELDVLRTEIEDEYRPFRRVGIRHLRLSSQIECDGTWRLDRSQGSRV